MLPCTKIKKNYKLLLDFRIYLFVQHTFRICGESAFLKNVLLEFKRVRMFARKVLFLSEIGIFLLPLTMWTRTLLG